MTPPGSPTYEITVGGGGATEALVAAGQYGYAHSAVTSETFPVRPDAERRPRVVVLVEVDREVSTDEVLAEAARRGLARPTYEDALHFGIQHPDVQRERPVVFLHTPWVGHFGRRDVLCLWANAGRRELGLGDFDGRWSPDHRFAFVGGTPPAGR